MDYKSSSQAEIPTIEQLEAGHGIQLILYLSCVNSSVVPLEATYFNFNASKIRLDKLLSEGDEDDFNSKALASYIEKFSKNKFDASRDDLSEYKEVCEKSIRHILTNIEEGKIDIRPFTKRVDEDDMTSCTNCYFKSICHFDKNFNEFTVY